MTTRDERMTAKRADALLGVCAAAADRTSCQRAAAELGEEMGHARSEEARLRKSLQDERVAKEAACKALEACGAEIRKQAETIKALADALGTSADVVHAPHSALFDECRDVVCRANHAALRLVGRSP